MISSPEAKISCAPHFDRIEPALWGRQPGQPACRRGKRRLHGPFGRLASRPKATSDPTDAVLWEPLQPGAGAAERGLPLLDNGDDLPGTICRNSRHRETHSQGSASLAFDRDLQGAAKCSYFVAGSGLANTSPCTTPGAQAARRSLRRALSCCSYAVLAAWAARLRCSAHRFFCAAAMRRRAAALKTRVLCGFI